MAIPHIGATGIEARIHRGLVVKVESVMEDSPAARERKRFRRVQLAEQLKDWFNVDFDDRTWRTGKGPIGKGPDEFRGTRIANRTDWGEGEFIVMRTTFEVDELNYDAYRLRILARQGYDVYLNGKLVETYVWWKDRPATPEHHTTSAVSASSRP